MGTRASFFIGNPENIDNRMWLGCTAYDSYPDGWVTALATAESESQFVRLVQSLAGTRDDFCDPAKHGFPFPWTDNLFLTDFTYAWFNDKVMMTYYRHGWIEMEAFLNISEEMKESYLESDLLPADVLAPTATWDRSAPDSIMVVNLS